MKKILNLTVVIGAFGYFVDIYDLVLFSIVRSPSLASFGLGPDHQLVTGIKLLNWQMTGLLLGGFFWGIIGDKRGRVSVLFGSILLYSLANIANAFVTNINTYAVLRFIAGIGLAGELGAAITLVSEIMPKETRGYGTAIVAGVGLSGAVFAGLTAELFSWRVAYATGGILGICLLILRMKMFESGMFDAMKKSGARAGDLRLLFFSGSRLLRFLYCILIAIPVWYVVGILMTFSPEICRALNTDQEVQAGRAILFCYAGVAIGDVASGFLSQWMHSRKKVVYIFLTALLALVFFLASSENLTPSYFYKIAFFLGLSTGYWAVFMTLSAEQFGTNLRATVTTAAPNLVRGSVVLLTTAFQALTPSQGPVRASVVIGTATVAMAFFALYELQETHSRDLNFVEG